MKLSFTTYSCVFAASLNISLSDRTAHAAATSTTLCAADTPAVIHRRLVETLTRARLDPRALRAAGLVESDLPAFFAAAHAAVAARGPALAEADARADAARSALDRWRRDRDAGRLPPSDNPPQSGPTLEQALQQARADQLSILASLRADLATNLGQSRAAFLDRWAADANANAGADPAAEPTPAAAAAAPRQMSAEDRATARTNLATGLDAFTRAWAAQSLAIASTPVTPSTPPPPPPATTPPTP